MQISFFIPAYNYAQHIGQAIASIMQDNFSDGDELVICNDGSTDGTVGELVRLKERWPAIQVIHHKENRGGGVARNTAIKHCNNPLLFCLDADNFLAPSSIPKLKQYLIDNEADVTAFRGFYFFGACPKYVRWPMDIVTLEHYLQDYSSAPGHNGNYMFTRKAWKKAGGYPENTWLDTWGFELRLLFAGAKVMVMPDGYYYHRRGHHSYYMRGLQKGSTSQAALPVLRDFFHLLDERDVEYVLSSDEWLDHLKERPLRLKREAM